MKKLFCILFLFASTQVFSKPIDDLNHLLTHFKTMQANFTEVVKSEQGRILQTSSGKMAVKRPGRFYWNKEKPMQQLILVNDDRVLIYDPDLEQVIQRSLSNSIDDAPAKLLTGDMYAIERAFNVSRLPFQENKTRFRLMSTLKGSMTPVVTLIFNGETLSAMKFQDGLGQVTSIIFSKSVLNKPIKADFFQLKLPKGVDVIRE